MGTLASIGVLRRFKKIALGMGLNKIALERAKIFA
jgi:hypothetical protein